MDVIILAGGLGTRLRSVVNEIPKCMAPIGGKPFLYFLLRYLAKYTELSTIVLSVGYLREIVIDWIQEHHKEFPFTFDFAMEETPLGTGGGIRFALQKTESKDVLVVNGDTFFDVNISQFYQFHTSVQASISIALKPMREFDRYGTVSMDENHIIHSFNEKQYCRSGLINGGMYFINKNRCSLDHLPEKFSFETEVLQSQVKKGNFYGFIDDNYFIDIGIPADYAKANDTFNHYFDGDSFK
jgi:D-glycero-alpha-D-manno-heptose 1-phosphate guanylyltransferase